MKSFTKLERFIGGMKLAIVLILLFTVAMIAGTFIESYYGTEFAGRTVYKTIPFMLLQFMMGLSIIYAVYLRLPPKKRLYGFYTIHAGLILIVGGSVITYIGGIDGNITLPPLSPKRDVKLSEDLFKVTNLETSEVTTFELPNTAFKKYIGASYEDFTLEEYLPYSEKKLTWGPSKNKYIPRNINQSSEYFLSNDNVSQDFILSLSQEAFEFKSNMQLGPLNIHYLPSAIADCFIKPSKNQMIIWDSEKEYCFTPSEQNIQIKKRIVIKDFLLLKTEEPSTHFFLICPPTPWTKTLR